jgi:AAA15 family ATPase/GTPase
MKIKKVYLKNIKSFKGECEFDFTNSLTINTISGINGSGKTTLFKSIIIAQRLFFYEQAKDNEYFLKAISDDLLNYFVSDNSHIKIVFDLSGSGLYPEFTIKCSGLGVDKVNWDFVCNDSDLSIIKENWNLESPKNLIVYVESNRYINEGDFLHEGVSLKNSANGGDLAADYLFYPDKLFSSIYERIIRDYLRERVIPNKPRKDLPHVASKVLIHKILKYIQISNFTGIAKENQFILQASPSRKGASGLYDVRNLSSGEKTIFYIIHFICYVKNIGMLIIDELENNLHENMLSEFVLLLKNICESKDFGSLVSKISAENNDKLGDKLAAQITAFYSQHELAQVYLLTHSKNLIYNNISTGSNYVIDGRLKQINYDDSEEILRSIGLSVITNKILFVEGKGDNKLLESLMAPHNIKVRALGSCEEVIDTYSKYLKIKEGIRDVQFCFMIDKDTRSDEEIARIRATDESSFDKYFIVLERHEIENYFLEPSIYVDLYNNHHSLFPDIMTPSFDDIQSQIRLVADKYKAKVIQKTLQNLNQKSFGKLKAASSKAVPINGKTEYDTFVDGVFSGEEFNSTVDNIKSNFKFAKDSVKNWNEDWVNLCDGKAVFKEFINSLVSKLGVNHPRLMSEAASIALNAKNSEASKLLSSIFKRFE